MPNMPSSPRLFQFLLAAGLAAGAALNATASDAVLLGRVADEQGHAISGAELIVRPVYSGDEGPRTYWKGDRDVVVHSGADGHFSVQAALGDQRLSVVADGYAPMYRTHRAFKGENPGWDFTLVKSAHVFCRILDTDGRPQFPRFLFVTPAEETGPPPAPGLSLYWHAMTFAETSAPDGTFEIRDLSPGKFNILVMSPWLQAKQEGNGLVQVPISGGQFTVAAGEVITNLEVRVRPPEEFAVAGRVRRSDGLPLPNLSVSTGPTGGGARTGSNGCFRIEGLDCLGAERFSLQFDCKITWPDVALNTTNLDLVWPGNGAIAGRVFDAATGSNVVQFSAAVSKVQLTGGAFYDQPPVRFELLPDACFRLADVPEGTAMLVISNAVLGVRQFNVEVKAGQTAEVECAMVGPAVLEGYLTRDGHPARASVVMNGEWIYADANGFYRIQNQPDGKQLVWFFGSEISHRYADVELVAGRTVQLNMDLGGPCAVLGTVRFPAGVNRCEIRLAEIPPAGAWTGGRPWPYERVVAIQCLRAAEPKYEMRHLPPGRYFLTAGLPSGFNYQPVWSREIILNNDTPFVLDIDLAAKLSDSRNQNINTDSL